MLKNMGKNPHGKGNLWFYTDSQGGLHRLENRGYYSQWKCDMWSSCWSLSNIPDFKVKNGYAGWALGVIGASRKDLIQRIEDDIKGDEH
jgi:hypothetical protein